LTTLKHLSVASFFAIAQYIVEFGCFSVKRRAACLTIRRELSKSIAIFASLNCKC